MLTDHLMTAQLTALCALLVTPLISVSPSASAAPAPERSPACPKGERCVTLQGQVISQLHLRNDSDFDPSERLYDLDGQTDGQAVTLLSPLVRVDAGEGVTVQYQLEVGWNTWSSMDAGRPNQYMGGGAPGLVARHKQAWGEWRGEQLSLRAGFQQVKDPTGLFLDHSMGALTAAYRVGAHRVELLGGQLPDTSFEGLEVRNDNYTTDNLLVGLSYRSKLSDHLRLAIGAYHLRDYRVIGRTFELSTGAVRLSSKERSLSFWVDLAGQYGSWEAASVGGGAVQITSFAAQAGVKQRLDRLSLGLNLLALSADDDSDGNAHMGAFYGSARNQSKSIFLTEDETRDRYDNLDERLGSYWGSLAFSPAGLSVADVSVAYRVSERYIPRLTLAYAVTLNPSRALGHRHVGAELALSQRFKLSSRASLLLSGLLFAPGGAAAAMINDVDREATELLYGGALAFALRF